MPGHLERRGRRVVERDRLAGGHRVDAAEGPAADEGVDDARWRRCPTCRPRPNGQVPHEARRVVAAAGCSPRSRSRPPGCRSPAARAGCRRCSRATPAPLSLACDHVKALSSIRPLLHPVLELDLQRVVARLAAVERVGDVGELLDRAPGLQRQRARGVVGHGLVVVRQAPAGHPRGCPRRRRRAACSARSRAAPTRSSSARRSSGSPSACRGCWPPAG